MMKLSSPSILSFSIFTGRLTLMSALFWKTEFRQMAGATDFAADSFSGISRTELPVMADYDLAEFYDASLSTSLYFVVLPSTIVSVTAVLLGALGEQVPFFCLSGRGDGEPRCSSLHHVPLSLQATTCHQVVFSSIVRVITMLRWIRH